MRNPRVMDPNKIRRYFEDDGLVHVISDWETQGPKSPITVYVPCESVYFYQISRDVFMKTRTKRVPTCLRCVIA